MVDMCVVLSQKKGNVASLDLFEALSGWRVRLSAGDAALRSGQGTGGQRIVGRLRRPLSQCIPNSTVITF